MPKYQEYLSNGVSFDSFGPPVLKIFKVGYDGLLARSGATEVIVHAGINADWKHARDYPMTRTSQGFETSVILHEGANTLNICFRDSAGNWDNNSGANYSFPIDDSGAVEGRHDIWSDEHLSGSYYWQE